MKKILLLALFVIAASQLKAQTIVTPPSLKFPSADLYKKYMGKGNDSLTRLLPVQPKPLFATPDPGSYKLDINKFTHTYAYTMPIVKLQGNSKMPVVKMQGNSKMPVVNLDGANKEVDTKMAPKP